MIVLGVHELVSAVTVDPIVGVVKLLGCFDWLLEIQMSLGYVFFDNGSADTSEGSEGSFFVPIANEGALRDGVGIFHKAGQVVGFTVTDSLVENLLCHLST